MTKVGILVGEDKWMFFEEIFEDLVGHYKTDIYKRQTVNSPVLYGRLNRWASRRGFNSILGRNDVCFFEWASDLLMPASQLPKHCPVIVRMHSFELYRWAPEINWDFVDRVILVSEAMRQKFGDLYPDHFCKTEVIHNGVSLSKFKPLEQRTFNFNIGMLCSINPVKRVYDTVLMISGLRELGYDANLHIAGTLKGDLRYEKAIHRLVNKLDLEDVVHFYGHVTDAATWLQKVDIFVSNSYWEGQQVALIEAMATGCYSLSHFWDGAEEILPAKNLFVTEAELQKKIIEYVEYSEAERKKHQAEMRAIACQIFDIEQTKIKIRRAIDEATGNQI